MLSTSVVVVSRGIDMSVVLTSLLAQDAAMPLHCVLGRLPNTRDGLLIDTLRRLGWDVSMSLVRAPGIGQARFEAAEFCKTDTLISLDDDAMLKQSNALHRLSAAAEDHAFACPVIRFTHCFRDTGIRDHTEIWEQVTDDDPRVRRALAANGDSWRRVYDYGTDQPTTELGGTAFACDASRYRKAVNGLEGWTTGGEDHYIGKRLCADGPGITLSGVHAYHVGAFEQGKWGFDDVGLSLLRDDPESFRQYAVPAEPEPTPNNVEAAPVGIHGGQTLTTERSWTPTVNRLGFTAT